MSASLRDLPVEQLRDLLDAKIETVGQPTYDSDRFDYFDDIDAYGKALSAIGYEPLQSLDHELSHGKCALLVGAIGVRYGIEYDNFDLEGQRFRLPRRAVTSILGPSRIPHLALAAFAVAPKDPSPSDLEGMVLLGYPTIEYLEERITRWNRQEMGLIIPMPGTIDTGA